MQCRVRILVKLNVARCELELWHLFPIARLTLRDIAMVTLTVVTVTVEIVVIGTVMTVTVEIIVIVTAVTVTTVREFLGFQI